MSFAKLTSNRIPEGLQETWRLESAWSETTAGRRYYDVHLSMIRQHETAVAIFERCLGTASQRILESGCGTGRWMSYFQSLGHRPFGVDHSFAQLQFAKTHAPEFHLCGGDVLTTPFRDSGFDAVFSSYVAEHFVDGPGQVLAEIRRVLRPDGLLFLVVPFANPWRRVVLYPLLRLIYLLWRVYGGGLRFEEYHFTRRELDTLLARAGFETLEYHPDDYHPPWSKGLYCDVSDVCAFLNYQLPTPFRFGSLGTAFLRIMSHLPLWWYCEGIFLVARCRK